MTKIDELKQKYPSQDPLDALYTWGYLVRMKVSKALKPYVKIQKWDGAIQWLIKPIEQGDDLSDDIELLAKAVAWEMLGIGKESRLSEEQAEDLADGILEAQKQGHEL